MLVRDTIFVKEKRNKNVNDYRHQVVYVPVDSISKINFSDYKNTKTFLQHIKGVEFKLPKNIIVLSKKQILAHKLKDEIRQDYDYNRAIKISFFHPSAFKILVKVENTEFEIHGNEIIKSLELDKDAIIQQVIK